MSRKKYSKEFKLARIREHQEEGISFYKLEKEYDIERGSIRRWFEAYKAHGEEALERQLQIAGCEDRNELAFQKALLAGELPYTIGGGIGQSRICMFYLRKAHIGEIQASIWPDEVLRKAKENGIPLFGSISRTSFIR